MRLARLAMLAVVADSACLAIPPYSGESSAYDLQLVLGSGCALVADNRVPDGCTATISTLGYALTFDGSGTRFPTSLLVNGDNELAETGFQLASTGQSFSAQSGQVLASTQTLTVLFAGSAAVELRLEGSASTPTCNGSGSGSGLVSWAMAFTAFPDGRLVRHDTLAPPTFDGCALAESFELLDIADMPFTQATLDSAGSEQTLPQTLAASVDAGVSYRMCLSHDGSAGPHIALGFAAPPDDKSTSLGVTDVTNPSVHDVKLEHRWSTAPGDPVSGSATTTFQIDTRGSCGDLTAEEVALSGIATGLTTDFPRGLYVVIGDLPIELDLSTFQPPFAVEVSAPRGVAVAGVASSDYRSEPELADASKAIVWFAASAGSGSVTIGSAE